MPDVFSVFCHNGKYGIRTPEGSLVPGWYAAYHAALMRAEKMAVDRARGRHKPRACLCCGQRFLSEGAHNRMCPPCRGRSVAFDGPEPMGGIGDLTEIPAT